MVNPDTLEAKLIKKPISKLKKILWKDFALWIKLSRSEDGLYVPCYTCGAMMEIGTSNCQAGHWISKAAASVHYFNSNQVRPQCYRCNVNLSGNSEEFRVRLIEEIGATRVQVISDTRHLVKKRSRDWYIEKIIYYRAELEDM